MGRVAIRSGSRHARRSRRNARRLSPLLFADGESFDSFDVETEAQTRSGRREDGAVARHVDGWVNDVLFPVPRTRRDISRKRESRQRRHGDVVSASDTGFQHAAAPNRYAGGAADVVYLSRLAVASHPAELDVDDP